MLSQFMRASMAVIAPELRTHYSLSPEELSWIGGAFFLVFALAQLPLGILLDRVGPRRVLLSMAMFAAAGAVIFATAGSPAAFALGRAVMGLGCSAMLMGPLVIYAKLFSRGDFAAITSVQIGIGTLGALIATAPLAYIVALSGWRPVFWAVAALTLVCTLATERVSRGQTPPPGQWNLLADGRGIIEVVRIKGMMAIQPYLFVNYPVVAALLTLWIGPYLSDVHGLDLAERGTAILLMAVANTVGYFTFGALDRRAGSRQRLAMIAGAAMTVLLLALAGVPGLATAAAVAGVCLIAFLGGSQAILMAHVRDLLPDHLLGRGVTVANTSNMLGVAVVQAILGSVAGAFALVDSALPEGAYRAMFATLGGLLLLSLMIYSRAPSGKSVTLVR